MYRGAGEHTASHRLHKAHADPATTGSWDTESNARQPRTDLYDNAVRRGADGDARTPGWADAHAYTLIHSNTTGRLLGPS